MLGGIEWLIIIVVVIVFLFGAKKIPEIARSLGRATGEFQRGKREVEREIRASIREQETQEEKKEEAPEETEEGKVRKAAEELGIDTEGKSTEELKKEIAEKMNR